jgi:hypothetical protein
MQFNILLITAILGDLALATYDIKLYKSAGCGGTAGVKCPGLAAGKCCARRSADAKKGVPAPWSLSHSANYVETGSKKSNGNDQIKIYSEMGGEACGLPADQSTTCASSSSKSISGAAVFVVVPTGSGRSSRHSKARRVATDVVEPSEYFYEDGKTEYSLPIKSARGEEFARMASEDDQIEHLKRFGKRTVLDEDEN